MAELPKLEYSYDALEPHIDKETMEIHHSKHHQGYTDKYNAAVSGTELASKSVCEVLRALDTVPEDIRTAVRNNGGGFYNHKLFWKIIGPNAGGEPTGALLDAIKAKFGSFDKFKEDFSAAAATQFGSGWAFLVVVDGELAIVAKPNQDSPLSDGQYPLMGLDVWEHSYYLRYRNKRPEYIEAWWNVVNW
ncbi:MAG: superoxide dismutase, partial [Anaerolineales bacterium]|nr:superoxide dismutase [Anaerolineales bacterium]